MPNDAGGGIAHQGAVARPSLSDASRGRPQPPVTPRARLRSPCCTTVIRPATCPRPLPRSRRHAAPGNIASSKPPPTARPAKTGPPADSEQPIALGVNFDKGVYVVRQLTPPSAQHPTSKSPWQTQALVSPELDQGPSSGRTVLKPRQARLAGANVHVPTGWPKGVGSILPGLVPHRQAVELFLQVLPMR